ncbi:excisionase family DNA binding protein [Peribacillus deserti]|uniref:Excisionase family DNA binding protein n=2 Tax=Peribacillus deserti TaxID=673318 RepID=A0ABS2QCG7_9BACI|nr:helix-turn-helix domain-containing protein [Peribacillus deserti]MBM7690720.1 excisionase family DNA binding protein [Peribacillus deserti]
MLSTKEISEMLNVSEETVRRWIRTGELEATQDGKSYVVDDSKLEDFVEKKSAIPGTSLSKMQNLIGLVGSNILANQKAKDMAGLGVEILAKSLSKIKSSDFGYTPPEDQGPEDYEAKIDSLNRQKKKLELEYQMKLLDIEDEIAKYQRLAKDSNRQS